ncbi:MAG: aminotransferase class IV [Chloroflexi bacterium]|nr:aminotransferase class IV [Chloroflexota bacterium]
MRWIYLNGELVQQETATVSALDRGLLYGYGVFETMRSYDGRVFRLEQHYQRLCRGAERVGLEVPFSLADLVAAAKGVLQRNDLEDARVRLTLTAGAEGAAGSVILLAREVKEYPRQLYRRGMSALVISTRRNETSPLSGVKSLNYLDNLLAREDARRQGADEAILLNTRGLVAEGSASNVFLVLDGRLVTPNLSSGCLAGITRQAVLELATAAGVEAVETEVELSAFAVASEAFLTGSVMEVMPLTRLDNGPVGSGRPGPVTGRLHRLYQEMVARETSAAPAT